MLSSVSLFAIGIYQRHLSPRKGYACAYRVEHGDWTGCSGYAKHRISEVGLWNAIPDIRARFKACSEAAEERKQRRERRKQSGDNAACGAVEGGDTCSDCASAGGKCGKGCDGPSCDAPDCGSCS